MDFLIEPRTASFTGCAYRYPAGPSRSVPSLSTPTAPPALADHSAPPLLPFLSHGLHLELQRRPTCASASLPLARKTYLNSGSYGLFAREVRAAFEDYLTSREERGSDWPEWTRRCDEAPRPRGTAARCTATDEIAITASASAGINALASALDFSGPRNKILVSDLEFPTSAQIWHAQSRRGARVAARAGGRTRLRAARALRPTSSTNSTKLVAITHVCFRNGAKLDVAAITQLAHARRAGAARLLPVRRRESRGRARTRCRFRRRRNA